MKMIDYDKLKLAHKLTDKLNFIDYGLTYRHGYPDKYFVLSFDDKDGMFHEYQFKNIDELITKLTELSQPQPKYKIGDKIYCRLVTEIKEGRVIETPNEYYETYQISIDGQWLRIQEKELYYTKQFLIEAQIKYWKERLCEELEQHISDYFYPPFEGKIEGFNPDIQINQSELDIDRCQHISDGMVYCIYQPQNKCTKCGELYR